MRALLSLFRLCLATLLLAAATLPAVAEDPVATEESAWQDVITGQIQAFRDHDAPTALSFAASAFKSAFPDPQVFFLTIVSGGYAPIMESRAHSFGPFQRVDDATVVQIVRLTSSDQSRYEAIYQLGQEEAGWRVQGVQLNKAAGIGI